MFVHNAARQKAYRSRPEVKARFKQIRDGRHKIRKLIADIRKAVPCADCGARLPAVCMDFDHRPGEQKIKDVALVVHNSNSSVRSLILEMNKCDVVCANCHRIRTHIVRH